MKKKKKSSLNILLSYIKSNPLTLLVFCIILLSFFIRAYGIFDKSPFGWDQIDNAWMAKNIIVNHDYPLLGMQAKGNSGVFIGPFYYYLVSFFYFLTGLDPIAAGIIASLTSLLSMVVIYFVTKKLFSRGVALIALVLNGFTSSVILFERVQWPVNFIPILGLLVFFSLYQIAKGKPKYIILLALACGASLHIHFTAVFYPIVILLSIPLFPRTKQTLKYIGIGLLVVIPFVYPMMVAFVNNAQSTASISNYGHSYYHGLHLRRMLQLTGDALIQFNPYLAYNFLIPLKFVILPLFILVFLVRKINRNRLIFCYLLLVIFAVPWVVMSTYSGELTDYYFSMNRFIALIVVSYIIFRIYSLKYRIVKIIVVAFLLVHVIFNIHTFLMSINGRLSLNEIRKSVLEKIEKRERVEFQEGSAESYLYYYYMKKQGKEVY